MKWAPVDVILESAWGMDEASSQNQKRRKALLEGHSVKEQDPASVSHLNLSDQEDDWKSLSLRPLLDDSENLSPLRTRLEDEVASSEAGSVVRSSRPVSQPQKRQRRASDLKTPSSNLSSQASRQSLDHGESDLRLVSRTADTEIASQAEFSCEGVVKYWGRRQVLRGVAMRLRKGEIVGFLGPNGAGKTTLFQILVGLVRPDEGRVTLNQLDVSKAPMYRRARLGIGYLPQNSSVFRGMTVEQNLLAVLELIERDRSRRIVRARELLDEFGIHHLRDAEASTLSGGEARRLEIARSLATRPSYILLDEPFAGIDPISIGEVKELVRGLSSRGIGILITDHNVRDTLALVDRGYIFYEGSVLNEGTPDELASSKDVQRVYLGARFSF